MLVPVGVEASGEGEMTKWKLYRLWRYPILSEACPHNGMKWGDSECECNLENRMKDKLSPSEALYGFVVWLTTRPKKTVMSSSSDAAPIADLVRDFIKTNKLTDPKNGWEKNLIHPKK